MHIRSLIQETGDALIAAMTVMALWEKENPWPDASHGITDAHYVWRAKRDVISRSCEFEQKAEANMAAYRAARGSARH